MKQKLKVHQVVQVTLLRRVVVFHQKSSSYASKSTSFTKTPTTSYRSTSYVSKTTTVKTPVKKKTVVKKKTSSIEYDYYDYQDCSVVTHQFKTMYRCIDRD